MSDAEKVRSMQLQKVWDCLVAKAVRKGRSCPNWRHESPEQSCAHRMAQEPLPAGALSAAASIGCCSVPLPLVPPALAPI